MLKSQYYSGDGQGAQDIPTEQIASRLKDKGDGGVLWLDMGDDAIDE